MDVSQWLPVVVSLLVGAGGSIVVVELIKTWRDKDKNQLDLFYPTWKAEMEMLRVEMANLRRLVVALSDELETLGGDPIKVRVELERQEAAKKATAAG